ncbi:MAG: endonuclease/exonuclease/phosphatase family protein [Alistipes sp.]
MSDYYQHEIRNAQSGSARRSFLGTLFHGFMAIVTLITVLTMLLTYCAPYITPTGWLFPILSLVAPATYILTVLLMLYWIIRWRWIWASIMIVLTVIGFFYLSLFLNIEFRRDYQTSTNDRHALTVMTYNVRMFYGPDQQSSADSVLSFIHTVDPDILCLQEFYPRVDNQTKADFDTRMEGYESTLGVAEPDKLTNDQLCQVIYSKHKIIRSGSIDGGQNTFCTRTVWADIVVGEDTLRVFNNHLRSTDLTAADDTFLTCHQYLSDTARDDKIRSIIRRFRDNTIARSAQADSVAHAIALSPYARIVCGDFNDTPMSYTYHTIARGLDDAFRKKGKGFDHTFQGFNNTLRIDYVLLSPRLQTLSYEVMKVDYSDHHPVVVQFKRTDN